jgi:hypothetical protein
MQGRVGVKQSVCVCMCVERERECVCVCERERERQREKDCQLRHRQAGVVPLVLNKEQERHKEEHGAR